MPSFAIKSRRRKRKQKGKTNNNKIKIRKRTSSALKCDKATKNSKNTTTTKTKSAASVAHSESRNKDIASSVNCKRCSLPPPVARKTKSCTCGSVAVVDVFINGRKPILIFKSQKKSVSVNSGKEDKAKINFSKIQKYQEQDYKLRISTCVQINSDIRNKANLALVKMKLRKGSLKPLPERNKYDKPSSSSSSSSDEHEEDDRDEKNDVEESEEEETTEQEEETSSSEMEDTDDEELFQPTKAYPPPKRKNLVSRRRKREKKRRGSPLLTGLSSLPRRRTTSESSTEESLPDLEYPVDRKWKIAAEKEKKEKEKAAAAAAALVNSAIAGTSTASTSQSHQPPHLSSNFSMPSSSKTLTPIKQTPIQAAVTAMGKSLTKSPGRKVDSVKEKEDKKLRALRSSDLHPKFSPISRRISHHSEREKHSTSTSTTSSPRRASKSPQRSPDRRDCRDKSPLMAPLLTKMSSPPPQDDFERSSSYALRFSEKKSTPIEISIPSLTKSSEPEPEPEEEEEIEEVEESIVIDPPVKRGRGRPRKKPLPVELSLQAETGEKDKRILRRRETGPSFSSMLSDSDNGGPEGISKRSTSVDSSQDKSNQEKKEEVKLKPSQKNPQSRLLTDSVDSSQDKSNQEKKEEVKLKPSQKNPQSRLLTDSSKSKQARDVLVMRARQSKIIAKTRVLQSNRYASGFRGVADWKTDALRRSLNESKSTSEVKSTLSPDVTSVTATMSFPPMQITDSAKEKVAFSSSSALMPRAKFFCDICDMTFTRRFSLTKHLRTIQHEKMARKMTTSGRLAQLTSGSSGPNRNASLYQRYKNAKSVAPGRRLMLQNRSVSASAGLSNNNSSHYQHQLREEELEEGLNQVNDDESSDSNQPWNSNYDDFDAPVYVKEEELQIGNDENNATVEEIKEWQSGKSLGRNAFECDVCNLQFSKKFDLTNHLWNHRNGDSDYLTCEKCNTVFPDSGEYNRHIDIAHLADVEYSCKHCPSKFSREDYLEKHLKTHKRDHYDNFLCRACDKKFTSNSLLMRHFDLKHLQLVPKLVLTLEGDSSQIKKKTLLHPTLPEFEYDNVENCDPNPPLQQQDPLAYEDEIIEEADDVDMPDIDLELDDANDEDYEVGRPSTAGDDGASYILPEDYGREFPVEDSDLQFKAALMRMGVDTTSTRIGCGLKKRINPAPSYHFNPLACKDCGKLFDNRKLLIKHVEYFNQAELHACAICKKKFKWRYLLNRHMSRHTREKKERKTMRIEKPNTDLVDPLAPTAAGASHSKELPKLLPIIIGKRPGDSQPTHHVYGQHSKQQTSTILKSYSSSSPSRPTLPIAGSSSSIMSRLSVASSSSSMLARPSTFVRIPSASTVGSSVTVHPTDPLMPVASTTKLYTCDLELCTSKPFTSRETLSVHHYFHTCPSLFKCPQPECEAKCERKSDMDLHTKCHETNQPFFLCFVCFKPFRWKKDMIRHVRRKHPEEKTYRCHYCQERFKTNDELTDHIALDHSEHRSFPCHLCGRRYAQRRYLIQHIQTQHGIPPDSEGSLVEPESQEFLEEDSGGADISSFLKTEHHM